MGVVLTPGTVMPKVGTVHPIAYKSLGRFVAGAR